MSKEIGSVENMQFIDKIVLNGVVGYINTGDQNNSTIGIKNIIKKVTFKGEELIDISTGFALTKEMEEKIDWTGCYASIRFVTGITQIDPTKVEETIIESYYGEADTFYEHLYSDFTGYLYTSEGFKIGGHDIPAILESYIDKYIHMEIDLYKEK